MVKGTILRVCYAWLPLLLVTSGALAHFDSALPRLKQVSGGISQSEFKQVIALFEREFAQEAARDGRVFEILFDWKEVWPQAFARRWETDHLIVYGGIARIRGSTTDSFALTLCHEVGHLYGGEPVSEPVNRMSVEGQADYWATSECWERVIGLLPLREGSEGERAFAAALVLTSFFADNRSLPHPRVETPDTSVVAVTNKTHPLPQCRLDTYVAGWEKRERPHCWWAPEEN